MNSKIYKNIKSIWNKLPKKYYWGSNIDLRYKLIEILIPLQNKIILDIGGAPGVIDSFLEKNTIISIDIDIQRLTASKIITNRTCFLKTDWNYLPFKHNTFDVIILGNVIGIMDSKKNIIIENLYKLLNHGGTIIISTCNKDHYSHKKMTETNSYNTLKTDFKKYSPIIKGWNPFPPFPFFFPNQIIHRVPFIWKILDFCFNRQLFTKQSEFLYIEINKNK